MKQITSILSAGVLLASSVLCRSASSGETAFSVRASSTNSRIVVEGRSISVTRLDHTYANPVSAIPSHTEAHTETGVIEEADLLALKDSIRRSGFLSLPSSCGAPQNERHYPSTIQVQMDGKIHEVVYRSNPSYPDCPRAFHDVERALQVLGAKSAPVPN